jgi:predicted ATPase/signal transduction histidine kinase/GAF domain-containing protein
MNSPEQPAAPATPHFDEHWLSQARWVRMDQHSGLQRWRVRQSPAQRQWLLVSAGANATPWDQARLDREYAMAPCLDAAWALVPVARLSTVEGPALVLDDDGARPFSRLAMGTLSVEHFLQLAISATSTLAEVHRSGIIHRDIRPENLMLADDGGVRLTGFAFAAVQGARAESGLQPADSSLAYISPEQAGRQHNPPCELSDLYALGVTFYQLLAGRLPFSASEPLQWLHKHLAVAPPPLAQWRNGLPAAIEALIAGLLAKQPQQRPESAQAVEVQLRGFLAQWQASGSIETSHPARLQVAPVPAAGLLVGRDNESAALRKVLARLEQGLGGCVLIQGEAGIGKTSLVQHLRRSQPANTLLFANGKCELSRHSLPYGALAAALAALFTRMMGEPPAEVKRWSRRIREAVGSHGEVIARVVPELEWLTGPLQPAVKPPVSEARRHLHSMLQRLLATIATRQRPLILFLDDVQWIDQETLAFLHELNAEAFEHLLLITTYRSEDLATAAGLPAFIEHCRRLGPRTLELTLQPLAAKDVAALLSTSLDLHPDERSALAERLSLHGNGNPLYVTQAIAVLREAAGPGQAGALSPVFADVAAMMAARLARLPLPTRQVLDRLAILGNHTFARELAQVSEVTLAQLRTVLQPALNAGLVGEYQERLAFAHDAIWESVRAQINDRARQAMHLQFALTLLDARPLASEAEAVFRIASQILQADACQLESRQRLAFIELLLEAAGQAKASAAAPTALRYLRYARHLLEAVQPANLKLARSVALLYTRCLILNADYVAAEHDIQRLLSQASAPLERAELYKLKCEICSLRGDYAGAINTAADGLASLGVNLPTQPTFEQAQQAWLEVQQALEQRGLQLFDSLPALHDSTLLAVAELLASCVIPGSFIQPNMMLLASSRVLALTLEQGMSAAAVHGLGWLGVAVAYHYGEYHQGFAFATQACLLAEQPAYAGSRVSVLVALDQVSPWTRPIPYALECAEAAYRLSLAQGTPSFACYANNHVVSDLIVLGAPIERMLRQIDIGLEMARNLEFEDAQTILYTQALYIRRLAGNVVDSIPIPCPDEMARRVERSSMGPLRFWWELFEGLFSFLQGHFEQAARHLDKAWTLAWAAPVHIHMVDLALFSVLNRSALQTSTGIAQDFEQPMQHLRRWANLNPHYFADRLALAEGEILRLNGHALEAIRQYEDAIGKAIQSGAVHIQGLAHEMEYRCLQAQGLQVGAQTHLRLARDCWRRWGASQLADQLEAQHPFLRELPASSAACLALPAAQQLDMVAITKACQALSREIEPDALIKTLLGNTTMHAGATYAALLLVDDGVLRVEATGRADADGIDIRLRPPSATADAAPVSLILSVMSQRDSLVIGGAQAQLRFGDDAYLNRIGNASMACVPLLKQNEAIGVLYLENTLTPGVFDSARLDVLELLAAQAAISLSTARLYSDLLAENQRRRSSESTLRRTQALMAIGQAVSRYGTFTWKPREQRSFWSQRLITELDLPVPEGHDYFLDATVLVHVHDLQRFSACLASAAEQHQAFRLEFRTIELGGDSRYLELAGEPDDSGDGFIGVVLDVTARRQAETDLRAARNELERTSQATILGELAASIAHEINQPLASILSNAGASVRWLERPQPAIADALEGLQDILAEGQRAASIVSAMRSLARQAPPQRRPLAIDAVIRHVLNVTQADIHDRHVSVSLNLAPAAPVSGDPTQLQQVMHNLITNAVEAMQALAPTARRLHIETCAVGNHTLVAVEDAGPGVPIEQQQKIFQAFYTTKASGMGMGLAICSSIISAHGGTLRAFQGRSGESLFIFTLPGQPAGQNF